MEGSCFSCFLILLEMFAGDWSSYKLFSTKSWSAVLSTIFFPWNFEYFLFTYALCCAFAGSYLPLVLFLLYSYQIALGLRASAFAISAYEYFFFLNRNISSLSPADRCEKFFLIFHFLFYQIIQIQMRIRAGGIKWQY